MDAMSRRVVVRKRDVTRPWGDASEERMHAIATLSAAYSVALVLVAVVVLVAAVLIVLFLVGANVIPVAPG